MFLRGEPFTANETKTDEENGYKGYPTANCPANDGTQVGFTPAHKLYQQWCQYRFGWLFTLSCQSYFHHFHHHQYQHH
jgi:hypothetical protein